jgi:hypothetical protein
MTSEIAGIPFPLLHAAILAPRPLNRPVTHPWNPNPHSPTTADPSRRSLRAQSGAELPAPPRPRCSAAPQPHRSSTAASPRRQEHPAPIQGVQEPGVTPIRPSSVSYATSRRRTSPTTSILRNSGHHNPTVSITPSPPIFCARCRRP